MLDIKNYRCLREFYNKALKKDKDYDIVRHELPARDVTKEHFHPNVEEWILLDSFGRCKVTVDFEKRKFDEPIGVCAIHIPKGYIHGLRSLTKLDYLVVREGNDEIVYLNNILKRKSKIEPKVDPCGLIWELYNRKNLGISYVEVTGTAKEHKHRKMEEKYQVKKGEGRLVINNKALAIQEGDTIQIQKDAWHYLKKIRGKPLEVLVITHPRYDPSDFIRKR